MAGREGEAQHGEVGVAVGRMRKGATGAMVRVACRVPWLLLRPRTRILGALPLRRMLPDVGVPLVTRLDLLHVPSPLGLQCLHLLHLPCAIPPIGAAGRIRGRRRARRSPSGRTREALRMADGGLPSGRGRSVEVWHKVGECSLRGRVGEVGVERRTLLRLELPQAVLGDRVSVVRVMRRRGLLRVQRRVKGMLRACLKRPRIHLVGGPGCPRVVA